MMGDAGGGAGLAPRCRGGGVAAGERTCSPARPSARAELGTPPLSAGAIHLEFHSSGNHYVWRKVTSTVHNIIVGKLWIDQVGGLLVRGDGSYGSGEGQWGWKGSALLRCTPVLPGVPTVLLRRWEGVLPWQGWGEASWSS